MSVELGPVSSHGLNAEKRSRELEKHIHVAKSSEELSATDAIKAISRIATTAELDTFVPSKERESVLTAAMDRRKELAVLENLRKK